MTFIFRCIVCLFFTSLLAFPSTAQLSWNTTSTGNINLNVCHNEDTVHVTFSNISGNPMTSDSLILQLPPGVLYISGSLIETSNYSLTPIATSTANRIALVLKNLPAIGGNVDFSFRISANCAAIAHFEGGGSFSNTYTYYHDGITEPSHITPDFNISYPALSFSNVTNANVNANLGATYTQELTITNGGNGPVSSFFVALNPPTGLQFSNSTNGIMNATNDTIFFANNHLGSDSLFTSNETIVVRYQITISNCTDIATDLHLSWGCDNAACETIAYPISASVPPIAPILSTVATPSGVQCFNEPHLQQVQIINTGTGISIGNVFEIFAGNAYGNTATIPNRVFPIDTSSIQLQLGTASPPFSISPFFTQNGNGSFANLCGANNQIGRARINLPDLAVGDTIIVSWTQMACCSQTCNQGLTFNSWEYKVDYENECLTNYTTGYRRGSVRGYDHISAYSSVPSGPTDINHGDTSTFILEYTNSNGLTVPATDGWLEVEIILPAGVAFSGNLTLFNRLFTCSRTPDSLIVVSDTVKAFFDFSSLVSCIGSNGSANKAEMHVGLVADCNQTGASSGPLAIPISTYLVLYPNCPTVCRKPMYCQTWHTDLHCPEPCPNGGLQFTTFTAQRHNLGAADNDNNGVADPSGSLDLSKIRAKTLIAGDTLALRYEARIDTGSGNPQFEFAYLNTRMLGMAPNSRTLNGIHANIQIFDASANLTYACNNNAIITNSTNNFSIDINACTPSGFVFETGDSIAIESFYRFVTPFSGAVLTHNIENDFYVSRIANPTDTADQHACSTLGAQFKTIGYYHTTCCGSSRTMNSCGSTQVSKNYYLSIGPCCSNYANGNYFRNEIRHFSYIDTFEFLLPPGYVMDTTQVADFRYSYTGGSVGYTPITPIDPNSNPVRFVLGDFFTPRGGTHPISDEGYYGTVRMFIRPSCNAPASSRIYYYGYYQDINPSGTFFDSYRGTSDLINYTSPDLELAAITPIVVSTTDTVVWQFRIDNNSNIADAFNTFFSLSSASGGIAIEEVRNLNTSTLLTPNTNGLYELGVMGASTNNVYEIVATQNSCIPDSLLILAGWDCGDYPTNTATYPCQFDSSYLKITNPESALQVAVTRDTTSGVDSIDICTPLSYEIELTSAQSSSVKEIFARLQNLPAGLSFITGSVQYEYPSGSGYQAGVDPTLIGADLEFDLTKYAAALDDEGLLGTVDADSIGDRKIKLRFQLETDCNFISGDAFNVQISAARPCGDPLPNTTYTVAPILIKGAEIAPYVTQINMSSDIITACGNQHSYAYNVSIKNLGAGTTTANDSILIRLPSGILFSAYDPSDPSFHNAPSTQPSITNTGSGTNLSWSMTGGVVPGDSVVFSVSIDAEDLPNICRTHDLEVLSLINTSIFCLSSGSNCITSTPSGRNNSNVTVNRPVLVVNVAPSGNRNFQLSSGQNIISIQGTIDNTGNDVLAGDVLTVEFFCDQDGSGNYTTGDTYIDAYTTNAGLLSGNSHPFTWTDTFSSALCDVNNGENIVAAIRAQPNSNPRQCACEYSQRLVQDILLPVDLASFYANVQPESCQVQLIWETTAEGNLDYYELQRSLDGVHFETLKKIAAIGSSRIHQTYKWTDKSIHQAGYYYRLKIVELGGGSRYSDYIHVLTPCAAFQGQSGIVAIYPNPSQYKLNIKFYNHQTKAINSELKVLDQLGRVVYQQAQTIVPGMQLLPLDVTQLPEGSYMLEIKNEEWSKHKKFVKIK